MEAKAKKERAIKSDVAHGCLQLSLRDAHIPGLGNIAKNHLLQDSVILGMRRIRDMYLFQSHGSCRMIVIFSNDINHIETYLCQELDLVSCS